MKRILVLLATLILLAGCGSADNSSNARPGHKPIGDVVHHYCKERLDGDLASEGNLVTYRRCVHHTFAFLGKD